MKDSIFHIFYILKFHSGKFEKAQRTVPTALAASAHFLGCSQLHWQKESHPNFTRMYFKYKTNFFARETEPTDQEPTKLADSLFHRLLADLRSRWLLVQLRWQQALLCAATKGGIRVTFVAANEVG